MTTVRRAYLYLASFIGLSVTLAGIFFLITLLVEQGFDAFREGRISSGSLALALAIAGGVTWRFYWRTTQRESNALLEERAAGMRKLYLYATMSVSLLAALSLLQQILSELLVRLLVVGLLGYKPWAPLLSAAILAGVWLWHRRIADAEKAAGAEGVRGGDLQRGYWFALAFFGAAGVAEGASALIANFLEQIGGAPPSFAPLVSLSLPWLQALIPPLAQLLVAGIAVWMFWLPSQRAAVAGDEIERASRMRSVLIHLVVLWAALWTLGGAISLLTQLLGRALQVLPGGPFLSQVRAPLSQFGVGGLLLLYFAQQVRRTLPTPRLSEYLIAGAAFFLGTTGTVQFVAALVRTLGGRGDRIEAIISTVLPGLIIGWLVWRWRWRVLDAETSGPNGTEARSYLWRKVYLYFYQLAGLALTLVGGVNLLQQIITAILGQPAGSNALTAMSDPLAALLVGGGVMIYKMQIAASDTRLGALSLEDTMRQTLGDSTPTWAIAAAIGVVIVPIIIIVLLGVSLGGLLGNIIG